jgi:Raf kinase inhibitor-like YbhB/YbcL family protein
MSAFTLTSPAFAPGDPIPPRHACEGEDVSPDLRWSGLPERTRSLALVVDDPDAPRGTFVHWLAWDIDPGQSGLEEGATPAREGENDFGVCGWRGPRPPRGRGPHRYVFRLRALDEQLHVPAGADRDTLEAAIGPHLLGTAELIGTYERQ